MRQKVISKEYKENIRMNKVVFIDCDQMYVDSIVIIHDARGIPLAIGKILL
jgi:hypothetical protein